MMFTWEWNPSFGAEKKPQQFIQEGLSWTYARGARFDYIVLPIIIILWAVGICFSSEPWASKFIALAFATASGIGWYVSRRFLEKGWRLDEYHHLVVLMRNGQIRDLGFAKSVSPVSEADFEQFSSKGFNSLRFPMLQFKGDGLSAGVIGTLPSSASQGFQIPFTLGFFYASAMWGSFQVKKGLEGMAWVKTEKGDQWLVISYTSEALSQGLGLSIPIQAQQAP